MQTNIMGRIMKKILEIDHLNFSVAPKSLDEIAQKEHLEAKKFIEFEASVLHRDRGKLIRDLDIEFDVRRALSLLEDFNSSDVRISCRNGQVEISGFVDNRRALQRVSAIAGKTKGVRDVTLKLRVQSGINRKPVEGFYAKAEPNSKSLPDSYFSAEMH